MEEAPVTAATGALGPVIAKLAALLGGEYKLRRRTRRDVKFIRSKLKTVHSLLWNIWEKEELDEASKVLKMEALDLADDVDDSIFDFILSLECSPSTKRLVQTKIKASPFQNFKKRASDVSGRCCSRWKKKKKKTFSSLLSCGKIATHDSHPRKPRAYPFVRKDASELVGMVWARDKFIQHLAGNGERTPVELQLKTASIYGIAGMGKTTLANLVYEAIGSKFQTRAFVSVTTGGNMKEVFARILQQVAANNNNVPAVATSVAIPGTEEVHLIDIISNFLKDKRYLVIIDDISNWREWEVIMKSLPENNLGSRIVRTTRITAVAEKWRNDCDDSDVPDVSVTEKKSLLHEMVPKWNIKNELVYEICKKNITTGIVGMKDDLVTEGFDNDHAIVGMCGGMPLAVCCMLSAVAHERDKQAHQGLRAKACDVQDEILNHVEENGIQGTLGFEPLVESLQLSYDDLPHQMLKTCLLYCSIYPNGRILSKDNLVRRWISERFVYTEEEANGYFKELVDRGFFLRSSEFRILGMHPMMQNFLRRKSREDNFITWSHEITPSYNTSRIRRLCIYSWQCRDNEADPLSALDWYHVRSLIVCGGMERVRFEKLEGLRVLDLRQFTSQQNHHLKDVCGLVHLRHLLGLDIIHELPPEIARLQCLETFEAAMFARLPGFIGNLQQLKTLEVRGLIEELPREIGALLKLETLRISGTVIPELPREIGSLQQLKTLDVSSTLVSVLPKEICSLQRLKHLNISDTPITALPKEIVKLQQLEHLVITDTEVAKIPREIGALKELKNLRLDNRIAALPLEACGLVELPECIHQALKKSGHLVSELAGEMLSLQKGGLVVGAKQMHIPPWIKEHFNDLVSLDIRICKLENGGLKILQEMPKLDGLTLRFQVVPRNPVVISSQGFARLRSLTVDSRVPRVTFQEGAMPMLRYLTFEFQFYAGSPNKDPVGINHLRSLKRICFECNKYWYSGGGDSPCIRTMIDVMREEAQGHPSVFL